MTWTEYFKDKILFVLLNLVGMLLLSCFLLVIGNAVDNVILILIIWILVFLLYFGFDYGNRNRYFRNLNKLLDELDKRYLISEVMEPSFRLEDKKYREILRKSNKSVIDKINQLECEQQEYKEYIESWIHEVKIPITTMNLICENNKGEMERKLQAELGKIENYVEMALFYARSDEVYKDYLIQQTDLNQVVLDSIAKNKMYYIQNNMHIQVDCEDGTVSSDGKWVEFMLNQILFNCVKYKNGESGHVSITSKKVKHAVRLTIEDNGIGIKESELPRIFDKGFTGSNGRMQKKSTGIGLYLCKKLCGKLGMGIAAESEEGRFTRIILTFPAGSYTPSPINLSI